MKFLYSEQKTIYKSALLKTVFKTMTSRLRLEVVYKIP